MGHKLRPGADQILAIVATLLALSAVIAVVATRVGRHYLPLGDEANVDLRVRDVFNGDTPLVGAYSRGFDHPGPLLYWLLAPLSALAGGAAWATLVGGAVLHGIAIAASGWLAFRRGGVLLMALVLAALALAYSAFPAGLQLLQTWNPTVAFPFFMLFLLQVWAFSLGSRWQALGAAVTASLLVQLHIGYLPLVGAAGLWAVAVVVIDARTQREPTANGAPSWRAVLALTALALAALWIAPVVQQLTHDPGNLGETLTDLRDSGDAAAGVRKGAGIFAAEFELPPPWLGGGDALGFATNIVEPASLVWLLVPTALLALGFIAAHRTSRVADRRLLELATVTALVAIIAISRVTVDLVPFVFYWRVIAALFIVVAASWAVAHWVALDRVPIATYACVGVLMVVIALFFGDRARDVVRHRDVLGAPESSAQDLFAQFERGGLPREPILVRGLGTTTNGLAQGLVDELDRKGVPVRVDPQYGYQYGDQRAANRSNVAEIWYVSPDARYRSLLAGHDGARLVAYVSGLSRTEDQELIARQRSLAAELTAAGRPDLVDYLDSPFVRVVVGREGVPGIPFADVQRIADLNDKLARSGGCRCTVIAYPASSAPELPYTMGF